MKAIVDKNECTGCSLCIDICPALFKMDTDDKAVAILEVVPKDQESCAKEAKDGCPLVAISIQE